MVILLAPILNFVLFHCWLFLNIKILGEIFLIGSLRGGPTILSRSLKTKRNKQKFQDRPTFFLFLKSYMTLLNLLIKGFQQFDPLTATGMAFCVNLGQKCQFLFPLVSD